MRVALEEMFALSSESAEEALRNDQAFARYRQNLESLLATRRVPVSVDPGERGDNLIKAMLALRIKFPQDEARAKLEVNIAMRTRR
jgi:hypothetical protein